MPFSNFELGGTCSLSNCGIMQPLAYYILFSHNHLQSAIACRLLKQWVRFPSTSLGVAMFRSVGDDLKVSSHRIRRVKTVLEHVGLYVGLALYTAVGGKVGLLQNFSTSQLFFEGLPDG